MNNPNLVHPQDPLKHLSGLIARLAEGHERLVKFVDKEIMPRLIPPDVSPESPLPNEDQNLRDDVDKLWTEVEELKQRVSDEGALSSRLEALEMVVIEMKSKKEE